MKIPATLAIAAGLFCVSIPAQEGADKLDLAVLYAGHESSPRTDAWLGFLRQHVRQVGSIALTDLTKRTAEPFDVVVVDGPSPFRADRSFELPSAPVLGRDFTRPTVLVGAAGGAVLRQLGTKLDWMCLCLRGGAHGIDREHEIFRTPYRVELQFESVATPAHYREYQEGVALGETLPVWRVHDEPEQTNVGLVADGYRFEDSPDAEFISGGLNSKNSGALALGRQANWFLWGFCASPSEMREEARWTFLNVLSYMRGFDGAQALHEKTARGREWALHLARRYQNHPDRSRMLAKRFTAETIEDARMAGMPLVNYVAANLDYVGVIEREVEFEHRGSVSRRLAAQFDVDRDLVALKIPNHDPKLLDRCVHDLERDDRAERARRLLERYTKQEFGSQAVAWRTWLDRNRGALYFSDGYGYRFCVDPNAPGIVRPTALHTSRDTR